MTSCWDDGVSILAVSVLKVHRDKFKEFRLPSHIPIQAGSIYFFVIFTEAGIQDWRSMLELIQ